MVGGLFWAPHPPHMTLQALRHPLVQKKRRAGSNHHASAAHSGGRPATQIYVADVWGGRQSFDIDSPKTSERTRLVATSTLHAPRRLFRPLSWGPSAVAAWCVGPPVSRRGHPPPHQALDLPLCACRCPTLPSRARPTVCWRLPSPTAAQRERVPLRCRQREAVGLVRLPPAQHGFGGGRVGPLDAPARPRWVRGRGEGRPPGRRTDEARERRGYPKPTPETYATPTPRDCPASAASSPGRQHCSKGPA